jgi:hypothetical protein
MDMKEQDGINLINKIIADDNLWKVYEKVKANKGAPGIEPRMHLEWRLPLKLKML